MRILIIRPRRRRYHARVKQLTLLRDYPLGPPLWQRILFVFGLCFLWVWLCIPRVTV